MDKLYIGILSCALVALLHYLLSNSKSKRSNGGGPPSPPAIPFLGHFHLVKKPVHAALCRLAARHGPLLLLHLGLRSEVVVSSAAAARECFGEHDVNFANRPKFASFDLVTMGGRLLATSSYGPHLRTLRRVATVQLLSKHRVNCMSGVIAAEVRAMVRRLYRTAAASPRVQLRRRLFELSLSVLMETIAHTKTTLSEEDPGTDMSVEAEEYSKVIDEINKHVITVNRWDYLPQLRWFDVFGTKKKILAAVSRRDAFLQRLIDAERRKLDDGRILGEGEKKSMIAVLLTQQKKEPDVYTDSMILGLCMNLFSAGTGTTSATIEWAMSILLNHPAALKKAQAEIDEFVGNSRLVAAEDLPQLSYLQCIISETLRLYPAAPLLLPHQSSAECEIDGHNIPSGMTLTVNAYAIHRDPAIWEDPAEFKPERFENNKAEELFMIPFGMGRRKCPGEAMALRTTGLTLGALLQCFDWELVDGLEVDMTEGLPRLILSKAVPFQAVCKPRAAMCNVLHNL